jgi:hypothetical protein
MSVAAFFFFEEHRQTGDVVRSAVHHHQRLGASVTCSMHDPRRRQLAKEGFEVAQILVCKKICQVAVISYRYTGVDEQTSALPTFSWRRFGGVY